jgi:hypothetical protein
MPKDRLVDAVATAWWFEGVRIRLGKKRPYGVEKIVEPEVFKKVKSGYGHTNKWRCYKAGTRVPRASLIARAEKACPGSADAFTHLLWRVARLGPEEAISGLASGWLRQLNVGMLSWFFRVDPTSGHEVRRRASARVLHALVHRADLDAIAALSILTREASESHRNKWSMAAGEALYHALLHAAVRGGEQMQIMLPRIFEMLVHRVFPFARDQQHRYCFDGLDIPAFCQLFRQAVFARRDASESIAAKISIASIESALRGGWVEPFGWLQFSLPNRPLEATGQFFKDEENFLAHIKMWQEAIAKMCSAHEPASDSRA